MPDRPLSESDELVPAASWSTEGPIVVLEVPRFRPRMRRFMAKLGVRKPLRVRMDERSSALWTAVAEHRRLGAALDAFCGGEADERRLALEFLAQMVDQGWFAVANRAESRR